MLRFGPPRSFTCASACPWLGHLVSGLIHTTMRPIQARFHCASGKCLKLQHELTRWIVLQKAPRHKINLAPSPCTHTISGSISLPFRGSFNLSLTVLVHYRSLDIFSLRRWTSHIQSGFHVSRPTQQTNDKDSKTWRTRLSLSMAILSKMFCSLRNFLTLC